MNKGEEGDMGILYRNAYYPEYDLENVYAESVGGDGEWKVVIFYMFGEEKWQNWIVNIGLAPFFDDEAAAGKTVDIAFMKFYLQDPYDLYKELEYDPDKVEDTEAPTEEDTETPTEEPTEEETGFHIFLQETFYRQWFALKAYANKKGVRIMGDIPFYLAPDGVERWKTPELFQLDKKGHLSAVAGVPPDAFSEEGQLWGNPLYNWKKNKQGVYDFWLERMTWCSKLYDAVRIDHFRAFHTYWSVPVDAESAKDGHWEKGPGMPLLKLIRAQLPDLELIAEDLGDLDEDALKFVRNCGIPGMKVMVFAFDTKAESAYMPHTCQRDSVVYTGTHDTPTFLQWLREG
ncbi:MAG: 4-alpha-glucanotransferase, partial [Clostridia bacterium]|nr:4-alpha-glucanotransferase [Clostridia bacterium]